MYGMARAGVPVGRARSDLIGSGVCYCHREVASARSAAAGTALGKWRS